LWHANLLSVVTFVIVTIFTETRIRCNTFAVSTRGLTYWCTRRIELDIAFVAFTLVGHKTFAIGAIHFVANGFTNMRRIFGGLVASITRANVRSGTITVDAFVLANWRAHGSIGNTVNPKDWVEKVVFQALATVWRDTTAIDT
jgi:hypothetical protein